jgi:hypothetical protein
LKVRQGGAADVETFVGLVTCNCQRLGTSISPSHPGFFPELWRIFAPGGKVRLFFAEYQGEPVSAGLVFCFGQWCRSWKVGWSGQHAVRCPNHYLKWEMILWGKSNGYKYFDLVSIEEEVARDLIAGRNPDSQRMGGATMFKLGFGGQPMLLPPALGYTPSPMFRWVLRAGLNEWLDRPYGLRIVEWIGSRFVRLRR